jgi:broad specificity phosphatase PhoE
MNHLYFCRHGESVLNAQKIYTGQIDTPLTEKGREQAKIAGEQAAKLQIDLIVASPLIRSLETAQIIAKIIHYPKEKIVINPLFIERSFGSLQGKPWTIAFEPEKYPDMESADALDKRVDEAYRFLQNLDAQNILLVGHNSFGVRLRTLVSDQVSTEKLPNANIVQLM